MNYKKIKNQIKNQNGSAIFLVVLILAGILVAVLGINSLVIKGIKLSRNIAWSAPAYFATETGMEKALYKIRKVDFEDIPIGGMDGSFDLNGQKAEWKVGFKCIDYSETTPESQDCIPEKINDNTTIIIKSVGSFKNVNRSIELSFCLRKESCSKAK
ncbi:hypothetical protein CVV26_01955 [Candidatus Kuenenbacteria bacterium HGW-Kuenenbacteria-1]|uniref:Type 4 fimbrial biogenesis protein PilX N-terminal domain-containing protein n=1 Tax=Candidatus Kuenenbacteria bacterium HGW-Kuenenbacteria-1 TaxID=2013812 RepID=A0A2N1UNK4_9BACT|nr:MAG: hypothetical protein CVV26_01955 [Candidatus Kuenenbacteria bacterium HGW-Kuenenbacteria-1]